MDFRADSETSSGHCKLAELGTQWEARAQRQAHCTLLTSRRSIPRRSFRPHRHDHRRDRDRRDRDQTRHRHRNSTPAQTREESVRARARQLALLAGCRRDALVCALADHDKEPRHLAEIAGGGDDKGGLANLRGGGGG